MKKNHPENKNTQINDPELAAEMAHAEDYWQVQAAKAQAQGLALRGLRKRAKKREYKNLEADHRQSAELAGERAKTKYEERKEVLGIDKAALQARLLHKVEGLAPDFTDRSGVWPVSKHTPPPEFSYVAKWETDEDTQEKTITFHADDVWEPGIFRRYYVVMREGEEAQLLSKTVKSPDAFDPSPTTETEVAPVTHDVDYKIREVMLKIDRDLSDRSSREAPALAK